MFLSLVEGRRVEAEVWPLVLGDQCPDTVVRGFPRRGAMNAAQRSVSERRRQDGEGVTGVDLLRRLPFPARTSLRRSASSVLPPWNGDDVRLSPGLDLYPAQA